MNMNWEQNAVRAEAMRICHEQEITDPAQCQQVEYAVRHKAYMRAIEPFQKEIAKLYGYRMLKRIVLGDSEATTEYEWIIPGVPKMIAVWEELIADEAKKYGYEFPASSHNTLPNEAPQA